ncbi:uncharacterized protein LOC123517638 isoform X2 [Portunus trituberculatus]|uniref:uncharacterized protein LOC123517638 isoform X2 n=1 Tax=Portunus trituberculatus TaxID=210409 RepID=UPI001E1CB3A0|nr:uncharacterized protein LOC123517638 isoform X2 [Portunus trituberculatus]
MPSYASFHIQVENLQKQRGLQCKLPGGMGYTCWEGERIMSRVWCTPLFFAGGILSRDLFHTFSSEIHPLVILHSCNDGGRSLILGLILCTELLQRTDISRRLFPQQNVFINSSYRSCHDQCLPREKSRTTCTIKIAFQRVRRNLCPTSLLSPANTAAIQEERRDFCLILPIYVAMVCYTVMMLPSCPVNAPAYGQCLINSKS